MDNDEQTGAQKDVTQPADQTPLPLQEEPGATNQRMDIPDEQVLAGHDTNLPRDDSPESLDQDISEGANREQIDPDHSIVRPDVDSIDKEEHGVN